MANRHIIETRDAPAAIGPYSQAIKVGDSVWISGCIPLDPQSGEVIEGDIGAQARRAFENFKAIAVAAGGDLNDVVRVGIYLTDLGDFAAVNAVMAEYFTAPYPTRSTIEVSALPRGVGVEIDGIMALG